MHATLAGSEKRLGQNGHVVIVIDEGAREEPLSRELAVHGSARRFGYCTEKFEPVCIERQIAEASWAALIDGLLGILLPLNGRGSWRRDWKIIQIRGCRVKHTLLPYSAEIVTEPVEKEEPTSLGSLVGILFCY
ncbi:hypothetical protein V6N13_113296 [Hibiscus sabdariffa]